MKILSISTSNKKGFTLIELMVVISIIALLSSIVLSALASARDKARATKVMQEVKQFQIAMEAYRAANTSYYINSLGYVPANSPSNMTPFIAAISPYIKIDDISFTKAGNTNFHYNYIRYEYVNNNNSTSTCGGIIPNVTRGASYDVVFRSSENIPSLKRWGQDNNYYCFTSI